MKYFILAFKNWNKFNGRANRAEYWYFVLFSFLIGIIFNIIDFTLLGYDPMDATNWNSIRNIQLSVYYPFYFCYCSTSSRC